jgi:PPOX class probable F420-dependent enzyme
MGAIIPTSHLELLCEADHNVLTTMMPDGQSQSSIVWVDYDGGHVLFNITLDRQKGRNMHANPKGTVLVIDPKNDSRWIEVRARVVEMIENRAELYADHLTQRYTAKQHFYGENYPAEQKHMETRVIVKTEPTRVSLDAIFK